MDVVTHALSGLAIQQLLPRKPQTRWLPIFFMLAACLPDLDILLCTTPQLFLSLHRGISHSIFAVPILALFLAILAYPLRRKKTFMRLKLGKLWMVFGCCLLVHLWLDAITTFGTRLFLPFSSYRVRLNANFILDFFLLLPLLGLVAASFFSRTKRRIFGALALCWLVLYPCANMSLARVAERNLVAELSAQGKEVHKAVLLPDFFTPLYWRAVTIERDPHHGTGAGPGENLVQREYSLGALGHPRGMPAEYRPLPPEVSMHMAAQSETARDFFNLMLMPVWRPLSERGIKSATLALSFLPSEEAELPDGTHVLRSLSDEELRALRFLAIDDLRFGSGLALGRKLLNLREPGDGRSTMPFLLLAVLDAEDTLLLERMLLHDMREDTGWKSPVPPEPQSFPRWLLGLD